MNPSHTRDKVEVERLEKLRVQLSNDMEAMQQKEASLRAYEQRLRLLVEHAQGDHPPQAVATTQQYRFRNGQTQADLDSAWEKYHRAHALLEAARRGLSDDRLALKEREEQVTLREHEVARREAWIKVRMAELAAQSMPAPKSKSKAPIARSPFAAARRLLSGGRKS
ncbi:MAG: hypothetical protein ACOZE5_13055 [Verrucomicrobiota bacterium]